MNKARVGFVDVLMVCNKVVHVIDVEDERMGKKKLPGERIAHCGHWWSQRYSQCVVEYGAQVQWRQL